MQPALTVASGNAETFLAGPEPVRSSQGFPMRWYHACCLGFLFLANPARPAEPQGRIVQDIWNAAYLEGSKSGYVHTGVREIERDGRKFYLAVTKLSLAIKRNGVTI